MSSQIVVPELSKLPRVPTINDQPSPEFTKLLKKHKISDSEYARIKEILKRPPTLAELGSFSAMWSEHCSYKSSRVHLKRFPTEGENVVVGPGENAGVVRVSGKYCLAFKMESHNHPSYIEPYQGAATGVGGILRDVFCMGARPIANLNALRFGVRSHERTPHLVPNVVKGIGDYGNCVGIPTVAGNVSFDESYNGNCLVNAMTVGAIHEDRIFKGYATGVGNWVVYLGSATGRDGIHGASMASGSFESGANNERSTVQVGDPFTEKLLLEATLDVLERGLVVGLQDMGAAGLTSSAFEMAGRAGNGLYMDLDKVPVRTDAMTAYELLLSESQERMLMVIEPSKWPELERVLAKWQLACTVIGTVTDTGRVHIHHKGNIEVDVPVGPMTDLAPKYERPMKPRPEVSKDEIQKFEVRITQTLTGVGGKEVLKKILQDTGNKKFIYEQYDSHIGTKTVHGPDHQGVGVLWIRSEWKDPNEPHLGVLVSASCNERYTRVNPRLGAAHAVLKSAQGIAAQGGIPLAITDCLNYGNPEDPYVMHDFSLGVDGISEASRKLNAPVVSGNVSLYNETDGQSIAPTPMIGMVGKMHDVRTSPRAVIKEESEVYLLIAKSAKPTFGGSLVGKLFDKDLRGGEIPAINWDRELEAMSFVREAISHNAVMASRNVGDGGIVGTLAKMVVTTDGLGLKVNLSQTHLGSLPEVSQCFGEISGAYLLTFRPNEIAKVKALHSKYPELSLVKIGDVIKTEDWKIGSFSVARQDAVAAFNEAFGFV